MENKFNCNDIVVVGDSFCSERTLEYHWPVKLVELLTGESTPARGQGYSGAHWWSTRRSLVRELEISIPKILVVCHTDPSRYPSDFDYALTFNSTYNRTKETWHGNMDVNEDRARFAAQLYYKYLQSDNWDRWTEKAWYKELDELIDYHSIPYVVHLFCFTKSSYMFKRGLTSKEYLCALWNSYPGVANHLSVSANISVATAIADMITNHYEDGAVKDFNLLRQIMLD